MAEAGWQEVPGGWMQAPDPGEADVDYFEADRLPRVARRAGVIDRAAGLLMDEAFDVESTWDAAEASGMPEGMIDSAGNVALLLAGIEHLRRE